MKKQSTTWRKFRSAALVLPLLLTGCFGGNKTNTTGVKINKNEKVTLQMWQLFDDASVWAPIIQDYERQNPNVTIEYSKKTFADYEVDSLDSIAARKGPDIWMVKNDWMPQHVDKLVAAPSTLFAQSGQSQLDGYKAKFPPVVYDNAVVGDKIYGLPFSVDTLVLYYNRDIMSARRRELDQSNDRALANSDDLRSAPVTWEDAIRYAKLLNQGDGGNLTRSGLAMGANNVDNAQDILSALMVQAGTTMVAPDRKSASFNLAQASASGTAVTPGKEALAFFRSFSDPGSNRFTWSSSSMNSIDAFKQGKVAMVIDYGYLKPLLAQDAPTLRVDSWPLPQVAGATEAVDYASYWFETVTNSSAHPDVAWDFLNFAFQQHSTYSQATGRPGPTAPQSSSVPATILDRANQQGPLDFQKASATSWYKGLRAQKVDGIFRDLIQATVNGDDAQRSLDAAAQRLTALLQQQTPIAEPATSRAADSNTTTK